MKLTASVVAQNTSVIVWFYDDGGATHSWATYVYGSPLLAMIGLSYDLYGNNYYFYRFGATYYQGAVRSNGWHKFEIKCLVDNTKSYIDDVLQGSSGSAIATFTAFYIGQFWGSSNNDYGDPWLVRKCVKTEPSISAWGPQEPPEPTPTPSVSPSPTASPPTETPTEIPRLVFVALAIAIICMGLLVEETYRKKR